MTSLRARAVTETQEQRESDTRRPSANEGQRGRGADRHDGVEWSGGTASGGEERVRKTDT